MSRVDDTFATIPASLLNDWGQNLTYIKTTTPRVYNPTTGAITGADTNLTVRGVITRINPREYEGLYQSTDIKVIIGNAELGTYFPTEADRLQYLENAVTREAKIISITSSRGDNAILHTIIARPQ